MIYNLYSNLPQPLQRVIQPNNVLADKLTTVVMEPRGFGFVHLYEQVKSCYVYRKTIALQNAIN